MQERTPLMDENRKRFGGNTTTGEKICAMVAAVAIPSSFMIPGLPTVVGGIMFSGGMFAGEIGAISVINREKEEKTNRE